MQKDSRPLADRLRPQNLDEFVGQKHILEKDGLIRTMISEAKLASIIFWGPPGTGKTTLARLLVQEINSKNPDKKVHFEEVSAIFSTVSELKKIFSEAKDRLRLGQETVLFVDEIHRFNKAQQDSFLPYVEQGTIKLLASTTENPSFRINSALLSRCHVLVLNELSIEELLLIIQNAEQKLDKKLNITQDAYKYIASMAKGDARYLLNTVEQLFNLAIEKKVDISELKHLILTRFTNYDTQGEQHYNLISALHKSIRGSDPDASLYWLARMLDGGEDPLYILRRLVRISIEDIGLSDPNATKYAVACTETYRILGSPEGELAIVNLVIYLALAPKSNSTYAAFKNVKSFISDTGTPAPPKHILNAPTKLMKDLGYAKDYQYDHNTDLGFSGQNYFPDNIQRKEFYKPVARGFEREMLKRLEYFKGLRGER